MTARDRGLRSRPSPTKFRINDIPDLTGKVTIVMGGNTVIDKETAKGRLQLITREYLLLNWSDIMLYWLIMARYL